MKWTDHMTYTTILSFLVEMMSSAWNCSIVINSNIWFYHFTPKCNRQRAKGTTYDEVNFSHDLYNNILIYNRVNCNKGEYLVLSFHTGGLQMMKGSIDIRRG